METNGKKDNWLKCLLCAVGGIIIIMSIFAICIICFIDKWDERGQFGDLFGAVNALFSGLAFAGLIITIRQQHQDLEYQRQSIEQTNEEMRNQTREFDKQNRTLKIERFENTIFKMLEVQQSIVNDLYAADSHIENIREENPRDYNLVSKEVLSKDEYRGRNMFYYAFMVCGHYIESKRVEGLYNIIKEIGKVHFDDYFTTSMFDHYFRHLYTILRFISENEWIGVDRQYQYATVVRSTLSRYELVMLYYNGFFHPKMKKMLEKYSMLNNLRTFLLPMSHEYKTYLSGIGINQRDLNANDFSIGDFEFYLTDDKNDNEKYHLSAFYTAVEMTDGIVLLERWRKFIDSKVNVEHKENN